MTSQGHARAAHKLEPLDRRVFGAGENEAPSRIDAAGNQRARVFPFGGDVRLGRIDFGRSRHTSSSLIAEEAGSAIGIGRPPTSNVSVESRPAALKYVWNSCA